MERQRDNGKNDVPFAEIIGILNEAAGTNFRASSKDSQKHIRARWAEGYRIDDFRKVIEKKCAEWGGTKMQEYLRPETLFGAKFEGYLQQASVSKAKPTTFSNYTGRTMDLDSLIAAGRFS